MSPSILKFDFDIIFEFIFDFLKPQWAFFLRLGYGSKTVLGSTHVFELLSFSMLPSILTFDFDSLFGALFLGLW